MRRLEASIAGQQGLLESLNLSISSLAASSRQPAPAPVNPGNADAQVNAQIQAMVDAGDSAGAMRLASRVEAERVGATLKRDHIDPIQRTGFSSLAKLTKTTVTATLPYYKEYQKDIDAHIASLPEGSQLDPDTIKLVHDAVVGQHAQEREAKIREEAIRSATTPKPSATPTSGRTGRTIQSGVVPTVAELLGQDVQDGLDFKGQNADQMAKRMGYASWEAFAKVKLDQDNGVMA